MNKYKALYEKSMLEMKGVLDNFNSANYFNPGTKLSFNTEMYTQMLVSKDRILCSNRYVWNLPINLTSQQLESFLYENRALCIFEDSKGEVTFARFTKVGSLNKYGMLQKIQPIDFAGNTYPIEMDVLNNEKEYNPHKKYAVILRDYTSSDDNGLSRYEINSSTTIKDQVTVYSQLMTNIFVSVKKALAVCSTEEQRNVVMNQVRDLLDPSKAIVAVSKSTGKDGKTALDLPVDFINFNNTFDTQNYCQTIDYYDKVRRSFDGVPAPDTFEKKERKITAEAEDTTTHTLLVLIDGLLQRQAAIELFKKYCKNPDNKSIAVDINPVLYSNIENNEEKEYNEEEKGDNEDVNKE